uniref:Globin domain-containing protein n=1 Tax=Leptobrachium leishanense TaxID=445787 RepID=A0A8C5MXF1_9ANUR
MGATSACLSDKEEQASRLTKLTSVASEVGAEVMFRFLTVCPDAKSLFIHLDQSQGSPDLLAHGLKLMTAIGDGIKGLDNLSTLMTELTDLHTNKLKITSEQMEDLSCTILVTLARNCPAEFTPECHKAWKTYLCMLHDVLLSKRAETP